MSFPEVKRLCLMLMPQCSNAMMEEDLLICNLPKTVKCNNPKKLNFHLVGDDLSWNSLNRMSRGKIKILETHRWDLPKPKVVPKTRVIRIPEIEGD